VISMLETIESDFADNLAKLETQESDAKSDYQKLTTENTIEKKGLGEALKHEEREVKGLDTTVTETTADEQTVTSEKSAVSEYLVRLKSRCIGKPDSSEELKKRRAAEIEGLREGLTILKDQAASFLQHRRGRGGLRGHVALDVPAAQ